MSIRKMFTAALLFAVSISAQENLVTTAPAWYPTCDNFGSALDTTGGLFQKDGSIKTTFTMAKLKSENEWPYIELICETDKPLTGTDSINVEYSCETPLVMKLYQTDLGTEGNQSYALYEFVLPANKAVASQTVAIKQFAQPEWADAESKAIALNLDHSQAIYFTPAISEETGGKATVVIKSLKLIAKTK